MNVFRRFSGFCCYLLPSLWLPVLLTAQDLTQPLSAEMDYYHTQDITSGVIQVDFPGVPNATIGINQIDVLVTASSVGSFYLDKGRAAGIHPGDEVALYPADVGIVNATVQSVSKNSSRCTILSGPRRINVGTRGHVYSRTTNPSESDSQGKIPTPPNTRTETPEHPVWEHPHEDWEQDQPLLAPAFSREIQERESELHGRVFSSYLHTWNDNSSSNQYSLGRVGASLWMDNPFRSGGGFRADGEFNRRGVFLADQGDDITGPGRLDRFSYHWGGTPGRPLRMEFGRFLSAEFPEFGVVDGTEVLYHAGIRHRFGASVGLLPEPFPNLAISNDLHVAVFYRWVSDEEETLSTAVGFQKTWHKATPDRDLIVWSGDYDPNQFVSIHGSIWCDFYDAHDTLKSTDFEITQAIFQPLLRIGIDRGVGAHVSFVRWPQLLRRDFSPFVQQQIAGDRVVRTGVYSWKDLGQWIRLNGRVDYWRDQDHQSGTNCETRFACRDFLVNDSETSLSLFYADGAFTSGPGLRVSFLRRLPWCYASCSYDTASYRIGNQTSPTGLGLTPDRLRQQSIQANLDFSISQDKSVNVFTDYRFGRNQNAFQTGLFFQKRL